jgi:hypothetical protein
MSFATDSKSRSFKAGTILKINALTITDGGYAVFGSRSQRKWWYLIVLEDVVLTYSEAFFYAERFLNVIVLNDARKISLLYTRACFDNMEVL